MRQLVVFTTLCFIAISINVCVQGRYIVQVRVNGYSNPTGKCHDDRRCVASPEIMYCCDGSRCRTSDCLGGGRQSDSYFIYCLRPLGTERELGCFPNEMRTYSSVNEDDGYIDFSDSIVLGLNNPLNLSGLDMAYEGVQIYIEVKDRDPEGNNDDLVDLLVIDHKLTINESLQQNHTGLYNFVTMNLTITVVCQGNFEGPSCTQCVPGFTGPNCDDVDQCLQLNCSGNGRLECNDNFPGNPPSFLCTCNSGYRGRFCEHINCSSNNCSGNGLCVGSASRPTSCSCNAGFTGRVCETRITNCSSNPCGENGQCVDGVESFICECKPGYSGPLCREGTSRNRVIGVGAIVGGVMGGIVIVVILLILFVVVVVVIIHCKSKDNWKEVMADNHNQELTSWTRQGGPLPGDNPVYQTGNGPNEFSGSSIPQITNAVITVYHGDRIESSLEERNFDNPIYGDDESNDNVYTVPLASQLNRQSQSNHEFEEERKVDNPIYGDDETDNVYTVPLTGRLNQQSLPNHEFEGDRRVDNPIYGYDETDNVYTVPIDKQYQSYEQTV